MKLFKNIKNKNAEDENKKGLGPIVAISLFMVVAIISVIIFNIFINKFVEEIEVEVESNPFDFIYIEDIFFQTLYLNNVFEKEIFTKSILVDNIECLSNKNLTPGLNILDIPICASTLDTGKHEIIVISDKGVYVKQIFFEDIGFDEYGDPLIVGDSINGGSKGCEELQMMSNNLAGKYNIVKNLFCENSSNWNSGSGFDPVGNNSNKFTGVLNGNGYTIFDLYINHDNKNTGLFGNINGATISNVNMEVNLIAGDKKDLGGIAGVAENSVISNVHIRGDIRGDRKEAGGLVGTLSSSTISKSSYGSGTIIGDRKSAGGLVGSASDSTIENSYSTGNINGNKEYIGGLVGEATNTNIINSYSTGSISGPGGVVGGLIGNIDLSSTVTNSFWDTSSSGVIVSAGGIGKITSEMQTESTYTNWDFSNIWSINEGSNYPQIR